MSVFKISAAGLRSLSKALWRHTICTIVCAIAVHAHAQVTVVGGMPHYSVPLAVPPGIGGMAPQLSLTLSAAAGSGRPAWAVHGVVQISRCPSNKAVDGIVRAVNFTAADRLCLNGQRLIQTDENGNADAIAQINDSAGIAGGDKAREFRTETDGYARIRAYGMAGGNAANGPAYFKMWTKNGQIVEFGNNSNPGANAQITAQGKAVVVTWAASRISNLAGNYIDFQYDQRDVTWGSAANDMGVVAGREWNLAEIRYTGHGAQLPANKVVFDYVERADTPGAAQDRAESYQQGSKYVSVRILSKIRTFINWPANQPSQPASAIAVKTVSLGYELGPVSHRSRPKHIVECAGASETQCLPAIRFNYAADVNPSYGASAAFKGSSLASLPLTTSMGTRGVLLGNFFGNGRTDIFRWSDAPSENALFRSEGNGTFTQSAGGIVDQNLFKSNGCYSSIAADFNGDGLTDILRIMKRTTPGGVSCGTVRNILYRSNGDGSFAATDVGIDFTETYARTTYYEACDESGVDSVMRTAAGTTTAAAAATAAAPMPFSYVAAPASSGKFSILRQCSGPSHWNGFTSKTAGRTFFLIDVNNDGLLDIVTTELPGYTSTATPPSDAVQCAGRTCTIIYTQQPGGTFVALPPSATNLTSRSVYAELPTYRNYNSRRPNLGDVNGDKLTDFIVDSGVWLSRGDGNFDLDSAAGMVQGCQYPIDFNGDGHTDCLPIIFDNATYQTMYVADGAGMKRLNNFNLTAAGQELQQFVGQVLSTGIEVADVDGDGRYDIIRWKDDANQNAVYLSNGDGTFRPLANSGLAGVPLQKSDGSYSFVTGDFSGRGGVEILRMKTDATGGADATSNVLYVKADATPLDQLASVVTGTGLATTLSYVPLTNSASGAAGARFVSDHQLPIRAVYPMVDLTLPMYVVATVIADTGVGNHKQVNEYSYLGLKGSYDGRGLLGFRQIRQQTSAGNGENLTTITHYLHEGRYAGKTKLVETRRGGLDGDGLLLNFTTFIYCDTTSSAASAAVATLDVPCPTSAKVRRPYLYQSKVEGRDLDGTVLPVTTTTTLINGNGDPTSIVSTTTGTPAGLPQQTSTRTVTNHYRASNTAGDAWMLGAIDTETQASVVSNSIDSVVTSAYAGIPQPIPTPVPTPVPTSQPGWLMPVLSLLLDAD